MNDLQKIAVTAVLAMTAATAQAQPAGGIFSELAVRAEDRAHNLGQPTLQRLDEQTAAVEAHLDAHPQDVRRIDDIGKAVLRDAAGVMKDELIRQPLALGADAMRTVLRAFRSARKQE